MTSLAKRCAARERRTLLYLLLFILLFSSLPRSQAQSLQAQPQGRWGHSATVLGNLLYVTGGRVGEGGSAAVYAKGDNFALTLDLTKAFDVNTPPWTPVKASEKMPSPRVNHAAAADRKNNRVLVYGGYLESDSQVNDIWSLGADDQSWKNVATKGTRPDQRYNMDTTVQSNLFYSLGGIADKDAAGASAKEKNTNNLFSLNMDDMTWTNLTNAPIPGGLYMHTFTYVRARNMLVSIGGSNNGKLLPMNLIYTYDISTDSWSSFTADGPAPKERLQHTAVALDDKIIVYGGCDKNFTQLYNDVAILDLENKRWMEPPQLKNAPPGRYDHAAVMVGNYMLITFGYLDTKKGDSKLYVLDRNTWAFADTFPGISKPDEAALAEEGGTSASQRRAKIIGGAVGGAVAFLLLAVGVFFLVRRERKKRYKAQNLLAQELEATKVGMRRSGFRTSAPTGTITDIYYNSEGATSTTHTMPSVAEWAHNASTQDSLETRQNNMSPTGSPSYRMSVDTYASTADQSNRDLRPPHSYANTSGPDPGARPDSGVSTGINPVRVSHSMVPPVSLQATSIAEDDEDQLHQLSQNAEVSGISLVPKQGLRLTNPDHIDE
ncbi:hypothetical protein THASP1DRAFT_29492 [Thamnocephalis sphaerospora]|uniref:Galactose oxidase n=1 Tax=Thamnocephalis sphaerospora TaxID=78915 RepID=A0A4P9XRJ3_9FUNG|nr:hypothetical protein THASP1DRAFT_29492 [Thamnocephalis sphaerospora]|eukprot:RKP08705.1 hypothetical protein THASP1DRAFT_29492 [Thamnocephalis sphaerospora]